MKDTLVEDFSKHPFAGLPVTVTLRAEDAKGQAAASPPAAAVLPMRRFYDPMARALVEQRRDLLWSAENGRRVTQVLRAVSNHPDGAFDSPRAYLVVRAAIRRLAEAGKAGTVAAVQEEVAEALWQAAVQIEDGNLGDAAERLAKAKERLQQALREGASDEEIARLMDELRQATRDYMEQMARDAIQNGEMQQAEIPPGQTMTQDQIQELMDRIQELSEQGKKAEAEALLEMLQQMLENMQMMMGQSQGGPGENGQGQQSMQGLADALREQQGLADESFQELQRQFQRGRGQPGAGRPAGRGGRRGPGAGRRRRVAGGPAGGAAPADRGARARPARGGRRGGAGGAARGGAQHGRGAPRGCARATRRTRSTGRPTRSTACARGCGRWARTCAGPRAPARASRGRSRAQSTAEGGRDPLGRPSGGRGGIGTDREMVPEADSAARARALLDEIRRRAGEQMRPKIELDYLQRLLDLF